MTANRLVIERAPTSSGPWSSWQDHAVSPSPPAPFQPPTRMFYWTGDSYPAPLPLPCFRARVASTAGGLSPWSVVKCMASAAAATNVSVPTYGGASVPVTWTDNSVNDETYYIQARSGGGRTWLASVPGTPGSTGTRSAVITGADPGTTCVTVWARDRLPGDTPSITNTTWLPDTPMVPAINPSASACFLTPYV
jgi:hypothetical protein